MSRHVCKICYAPLPRDQVTCGGLDCRDAWKFLNSAARRKHTNLATMSPSERAYVLAAGPSNEELEAQAAQREALQDNVEEYQVQQQKRETPKFLQEMMNPDNLKHLIKEEETINGDPIPTDASNPTSTTD